MTQETFVLYAAGLETIFTIKDDKKRSQYIQALLKYAALRLEPSEEMKELSSLLPMTLVDRDFIRYQKKISRSRRTGSTSVSKCIR